MASPMEISHLLSLSSPSPSLLPLKSSLFRVSHRTPKPLTFGRSNFALNQSELRAMESRTRASLVDDNGSSSTTTTSQSGIFDLGFQF